MSLLAQVDVRDLIGDLLPFLIVVLLGVMGFGRKIFEAYVDREKRRAKSEGRPERSPFSSLRQFIEGLQPQEGTAGTRMAPPVRPKVVVGDREDVGSPSRPEPVMELLVRTRDEAQAAFERGTRSGVQSRRRTLPPPPMEVAALPRRRSGGVSLAGRRVSLGQAVRLSEILGRPMALRSPGELPPGLDEQR